MNTLCLLNCISTTAGWIEWGYQKLNARHLRSKGMTQGALDYLMWHHFGRVYHPSLHISASYHYDYHHYRYYHHQHCHYYYCYYCRVYYSSIISLLDVVNDLSVNILEYKITSSVIYCQIF